MTFQYLPRFKKQYRKLSLTVREQFANRLKLFIEDPTHPQLRIHPLKGKYAGYWSMNINGDVRAIYCQPEDTLIIFALIGTHSELYGWIF